ncbi:MAG: tripartite tricarboxylate transporter permease [Synergistaceae bacterium]|nr:tripartite tricarboxylate transporter permease [Synergistaceae bacterium]
MNEFMRQFGLFLQAGAGVFSGINLIIVAIAVLLGLIVGAIPGLTGTMALALLINLTYKLPSDQAVAFMLGVYVGAVSGGLFSAIMLNIPGTPNAAATALDGYPLAKQGKGGKALFGGVFASCLGTLISCLIMLIATPFLSQIALKFGKWEMFLLAIFGITICGNLSVDCSPLKGWIAGFLGFFVALIGVEALYNAARFVFTAPLRSGVELIPALIGLFGVAEVLTVLQDRTPVQVNSDMGSILPNREELKQLLRPLFRSSLIGCGIGAIPGAGEDIAAWLSYSTGKSRGKDRANFGKGSFEGLACSETANNACIPGAMIPMLTLAIPGSTQAAMFLAALNLHGVQPGPMLTVKAPAFVYSVGLTLIVAAIVMVILALVLTKPMVKILQINRKVLMPIIVVLTVVGAYASRMNLFDIKLMLVFGVIGFMLRKMNFPLAPLTLGLILGGTADTNFRQSLTMGGSVLTRLVGDILLVVVLYSLISGALKTIKSAKAELAAEKS